MTSFPRHWLMKSEPEAYSIEDLAREGTTLWDGIRNYQARNFMRSMQIGDRAQEPHGGEEPSTQNEGAIGGGILLEMEQQNRRIGVRHCVSGRGFSDAMEFGIGQQFVDHERGIDQSDWLHPHLSGLGNRLCGRDHWPRPIDSRWQGGHGPKQTGEFGQERFWLEEVNEGGTASGRCRIGFDHQKHLSHLNDPRNEGLLHFLRR